MAGRGKLIAVMGDEDTVTGFLLGGIGELDKHLRRGLAGVSGQGARSVWGIGAPRGPEERVPPLWGGPGPVCRLTPRFAARRGFLAREDVGMILISQALAEQIRPAVAAHARALPAVLEIPSKDHPYDPARDSVLRRARGLFAPDELR
ncbi:VATF ATPase, partial [Copsychus sechellarum]|nr:VATF ATPase [Copsychus sechellarum]